MSGSGELSKGKFNVPFFNDVLCHLVLATYLSQGEIRFVQLPLVRR